MSKAKDMFGIFCPNGGIYYVCENSTTPFMGCCANDPCGENNGTCAQKDLRFTSYHPRLFLDLPDQDCDNSKTNGTWYNCGYEKHTFMGCCGKEACGFYGCAADDLVPAVLSSNHTLKDSFLNPESTDPYASASSITTSSTSTPDDRNDELGGGVVAGIVAGALVGGWLIIAAIIWLFWLIPQRRRQNKTQKANAMRASSQPYELLDGTQRQDHGLSLQFPSGVPLIEYARNENQPPDISQSDRSQSYSRYSEIALPPPQNPAPPTYGQACSTPQSVYRT